MDGVQKNFPAPPTTPFFPKSQEQPLPFSLQRPVRFSSSRLPFFTWPNTAPCPWMQQQLALADASARPAAFAPLFPCSFSLTQQQSYLPCTVPLSARSAAVASKFPAPNFSCHEQQLRRLRAARCFALRSEQHVGMPAGCLLFCAAPSSSSFTPVRPRRSLFDFASTLFSYD
jgi:hypothetical protein